MYKDITFKAIADQIQTEYIPNETAKNRDIDRKTESDSQIKKFIKHWVQCFQFHLRALTLGHGEKMVRTELHYDEGVTQT